MSKFVTESMTKAFSSNVFHLSQQKGSRFGDTVRVESQSGEIDFYDRIGTLEAQELLGRHQQTTYQDVPYSRRAVSLRKFWNADLVDKLDKLKIIHSPESEYAKVFSNSMGRARDDLIIIGILGTAYAGKEGTIPVPLPDTQKMCAIANDGSNSGGLGHKLTVSTLRKLKRAYEENEVEEIDMEDPCVGVAAAQLEHLLQDKELTSIDFNNVKALVDGDVNKFMGFKFIRSQRLPFTDAVTNFKASTGKINTGSDDDSAPVGSRRCISWVRSGIMLSIGEEVNGRVDILPTMNYSTQVYYSMTMGSTRMEEEKVFEIICSEE